VRKRDVLGFLREVDDDERFLAQTLLPHIIHPVPHGFR
jgi:hypothetical protein